MSEDISSKVKKLADHLGIDEGKVTDEASLQTILEQIVWILLNCMAFEEEFGSEISDRKQKILTVGDAIKFIESKAANYKCP